MPEVIQVPAAARPSEHFDADAATNAYLAEIPASARARSDAYFEGGYWLILWDFLYAAAISMLLLSTRVSARMRSAAERITPFQSLHTIAYWVQYLVVTFVVGAPLAVYEGFIREHQYGLATQTFGPWLGDQLKTLTITAVLAAFALDEGESCASIETAVPQASKAFKSDSNGNWWIEQEHFVADFAADIPPAQAHFMAISQVPISTDSFTHKVTNPAWKNKPTWYMVAGSDRSINPIQERMMAKRANAKTVEVNSSHVAYMSHPKEAAKLIEEAAASAHVNK